MFVPKFITPHTRISIFEFSLEVLKKRGRKIYYEALFSTLITIFLRSFNLCLFRNLLRSTNLEQIKLKLFMMRHSKQILLTQRLEILVGDFQPLCTTHLRFPA
jgi:hypothetical protein